MVTAEQLEIVREHDAPRGRYIARMSGGNEAELTYLDHGDVRVIDHTVTPAALRGKGVAGALTSRALADAQNEGMRVDPACSYAAAWLRRHPEYQAIIATGIAAAR